MKGKTVVITGASDGIGKAGAIQLARMGATVWMVGREDAKTASVCETVKAESGNASVRYLLADLSSQASVRELAAKLLAECPRIDVLLNNAGAVYNRLQLSADGIEMQFALNHMAPYLLTRLLMDRIRLSGNGRIIQTSSAAHYDSRDRASRKPGINFDDLYFSNGYSGLAVYAQSKACNVLFTAELARRLKGSGIVTHCFHPGVVRTGIGNKHGGWLFSAGWSLIKPFMITPEKGAETMVFLASSDEAGQSTGKYWTRCKEKWPKRFTQDPEIAARLWKLSAGLCGLPD